MAIQEGDLGKKLLVNAPKIPNRGLGEVGEGECPVL